MKTFQSLGLCGILLWGLAGCQSEKPESPNLVKPLMAGLEVPREILSFNADSGATLNFTLGAEVQIPAAAIVDAKGKEINGSVKVHCTQYLDALDFAIAGINMNYDSAGTQYMLQSDGMLQLRAFQNGSEVFLKEGARLSVSLPALSSAKDFNLYTYDSLNQTWAIQGTRPSLEEQVRLRVEPATDSLSAFEAFDSTAVASLPKPKRANPDRLKIEVEVPEEAKVAELRIFDNTKFELLEEDTVYREEHALVNWDWAEVRRTRRKGIFKLVFSNSQREVAYLVRPVYEGQDYETALLTYEREKQRLKKLRQEELAALEKVKAEREAERLRLAMAKRLARAEANGQNLADLKTLDAQKRALNRIRLTDINKQSSLVRNFRLNEFGTFNCDKIWRETNQIIAPIALRNRDGDTLYSPLSLLFMEQNTSLAVGPGRLCPVPQSGEAFVLTVEFSKLYYSKVDLSGIKPPESGSKTVSFQMTEIDAPVGEAYQKLRSLMNI
jgi:hypothetical protein